MKKHCCHIAVALFYILCFISLRSDGQPSGWEKLDSLEMLLKNYKPSCAIPCLKDSIKIDILTRLAFEYSEKNPDTADILNKEALQLANDIGWEKGIAFANNLIGWVFYVRGQYNLALQYYKKALTYWENVSKTKGLTRDSELNERTELGNIAVVYADIMQLDSALEYNFRCLKINERFNVGAEIAKSYGNIGIVYKKKGDYLNALEYYFKALKINKQFHIKISEAKNLGNIANVYINQGDYTTGLDYLIQSVRIQEELKNKRGMAIQYSSIANIFWTLNNSNKAIEYSKKSKEMYADIKNMQGVATNIQLLGEIYYKQKKYEESHKEYDEALNIYEGLKYDIGIANVNSDLGSLYADLGDISNSDSLRKKNYSLAFNGYFKSLEIDKRLKDQHSIASDLGNIGSLYGTVNNLKEAEKYLKEALVISSGSNDLILLIDHHKNLSELYAKSGNYSMALDHYKSSVNAKDSLFDGEKTKEITRKEMNYGFEKKEIATKAEQDKKEALAKAEYDKQIAVAEADKLRGIAEADKRRALTELNKNLELAEADKKFTEAETNKRMAISEADKKRLIAEADKKNIKIESEKQMADAKSENEKQKLLRNSIAGGAGVIILSSLLIFFFYKRKRDADQKQKETALSLQVSETEMKALRSQMNPHFIFNALQSIQTFLMSHQPEDANTYLLKFSKLMRLVLENSQYSEVPLKEDMQALELYMQLESIRLQHPFTYQFHIDDSVDIENDSIPPLILQPFVENAIWHGLQYKSGPGHININISRRNNALYATVEDDGVGRNNSKKTEHTILIKKESLGMKLTEERLKILNELKNIKAEFSITDLFTKDNQSAGTRVELSLPLVA